MYGLLGKYPPQEDGAETPSPHSVDWLWFKPRGAFNAALEPDYMSKCDNCEILQQQLPTDRGRMRCFSCGRFMKRPKAWDYNLSSKGIRWHAGRGPL